MKRKNPGKVMRYLVVVCALVSALAMVGCGGDDGADGGIVTSGETIPNVNSGPVNVSSSNVQALTGQPFTFQNGSIFDPSIGNNPATLTFTNPTAAGQQPVSLTSGSSTSSGNATFGSCTLTFTQGALAGKAITFTTCTFQVTSSNVTVGGASVNGTLTLTLSGPNGSSTSAVIIVQVSILSNGTLLINGVSTGIILSSAGSPITTGTTGTGGQ
jgi:hypothetical protein